MYKFTLAMSCLLDDVNVTKKLEDLFFNMKNGNNLQQREIQTISKEQTERSTKPEYLRKQIVTGFQVLLLCREPAKKNIIFFSQALVRKTSQADALAEPHGLHQHPQNRTHFNSSYSPSPLLCFIMYQYYIVLDLFKHRYSTKSLNGKRKVCESQRRYFQNQILNSNL